MHFYYFLNAIDLVKYVLEVIFKHKIHLQVW